MATGVGKPQADSECNERIPPDGFDAVALENCCPRISPRGDVGIAPTRSKRFLRKIQHIKKRFSSAALPLFHVKHSV